MNNILSYTIGGNTVAQYAIALVIILAALLLSRVVARYLAGWVFYLFNKKWRMLTKGALQDYLTGPLATFITVLISVSALDKLTWPPELDLKIYHISLSDIFRMAGTFSIIFTFFRAVLKFMDFITLILKHKYTEAGDLSSHQIIFFFKDLFKIIIGLVGALFILKYAFSYDIKGLLTGLSIVGAAIALALKQSLENLIASFIIFFDKPFKPGDAIKFNNLTGTVERIGLRSTRIRSDAKTYITVPNSQLVDSVVDNQSKRTQRRGDLKLEIEPATPPEKINQLLEGLKKIFTRSDIESHNLYLTDISANAIVIACDYYTPPTPIAEFNTTRQQVNIESLQLMDTLGIKIAGQVTDIKIMEGIAGAMPQKPII